VSLRYPWRAFVAIALASASLSTTRATSDSASVASLSSGTITPGGTLAAPTGPTPHPFADTGALVDALAPQASQRDALARHLEIEESIAGQPLTPGNQVQLLENGPVTYKAMFAALRGARRFIHLESYIFDSDDIGKQFAHLLMQKRQEGLQVALMIDAVGTVGADGAMFDQMRAAGIEVAIYHPLDPVGDRQPYAPDMRDHRKLLVVDDLVGLTGGINVSGVYSSAPSGLRRHPHEDPVKLGWRDTQVRLQGPSVLELDKLFLNNWRSVTGQALPPVALPVAGPTSAMLAAGNAALHVAPVSSTVVRIIDENPSRDKGHAVYATLLAQLSGAEQSIDITMGYFVPDPRFMNVLMEAAKRGVDVRLVLPSISDSWVVISAGRAKYQPLLDSGVKIYELSGALLHAKTTVVDGVWSTVGSSNMDWRSFGLNKEVNAVILGPAVGDEMQKQFAQDLKSAEPITKIAWADRPILEKAKERIAVLLERWL
jgi:cardiolipin synthase A/B